MNASVKGYLSNLNKAYKAIDFNGRPMSKEEVKAVLLWADSQGIKTILEIPHSKIYEIINEVKMEKSKIDMFSNLKIGDKFRLNRGSYKTYEKLNMDSYKIISDIVAIPENNVITAKQDDLFCVVYPV